MTLRLRSLDNDDGKPSKMAYCQLVKTVGKQVVGLAKTIITSQLVCRSRALAFPLLMNLKRTKQLTFVGISIRRVPIINLFEFFDENTNDC